MFVRFIAIAALTLTGVSSVAAADDLRAAASKVAECRTIADDSGRLNCLDAAALELSLALEGPQAVTAPEAPPAPVVEAPKEPEWAKAPEPRRKSKREMAAIAAPEPEAEAIPEKEKNVPIWARVFRNNEQEKTEDRYTVSVTRITRNNVGRHFFHTSEGQVWQQTIVGDVKPPKSLPIDAEIQRRVMGNPVLSFVGGPKGEYTVRRIE